jgi:predicted  nucleic acid-binding Zn-ribbon protein
MICSLPSRALLIEPVNGVGIAIIERYLISFTINRLKTMQEVLERAKWDVEAAQERVRHLSETVKELERKVSANAAPLAR